MKQYTTRTTKTMNPYHILVKRCCASCRHKEIRRDGARVCRLTTKVVQQLGKCRRWQMSKSAMQAGRQEL